MFDTVAGDVRFAFRMLRKSPGFTTVAVLTLALAIGANSAVFTVVDRAILRALAYPQADRLFVIHEVVPKFAHLSPLIPVSGMHFREWRQSAGSLDNLALVNGISLNLTGSGDPERLRAARVSPSLFRILGVQAQLGRTFLDEEDSPGRDRVAVLNHELWVRRFGGDPGVIGRKITLNSQPYEVIGVLPAEFRFPKLSQLYAMSVEAERPEIWKPLALRDEELEPMGEFNFACIARLKPGVSPAQAVSELNVIQAGIASRLTEKVELRVALVRLDEQITGRARTGLTLLLAAVAAVLLIGCVNVANLMLTRAAGRRREMAIRAAMGASAGRLARQALVESLLLSGAGGLLGLGVAWAAIRVLVSLAPMDLPRLDEVHTDAGLLAVTLAIATAAGLLSGVLPAWRLAHGDPQEALQSVPRGATAGRGSARLRGLLVSLEVGLSAMCLIAGGLLLHSMVKLLHVDRGFESERILTVSLTLPSSRYPDLQKRQTYLHSLLDRLRDLPGIGAVGLSNMLPLSGEGSNNLLGAEGTTVPLLDRPLGDIGLVNPDYFRAIGIPLRAGRVFAETDRGRNVALVSTLAAARLWPGQDPVGKRFRVGADSSPLLEVVGVVGDLRRTSLNKSPALTIYQPYWQRFYGQASLAIRTSADPAAAASAIRAAIRQSDPELPIPAFRAMDEIVAESVAPRRFQMGLVLLFAALATLLASLGIYGVVSYAVTQRTNEIGVRMALGARPAGIRVMVLRQGLVPVAAGLAAGAAASLALGRLLGSLLFGVTAADPITFAGVIGLLGAVAVGAIAIPAGRATRVDPSTALRY